MSVRQMVNPEIAVERRGVTVVITFRVPDSKYGPVRVVLSDDALSDLSQKVSLA